MVRESLLGIPGRSEHIPQSDNKSIMAPLIQTSAGVNGQSDWLASRWGRNEKHLNRKGNGPDFAVLAPWSDSGRIVAESGITPASFDYSSDVGGWLAVTLANVTLTPKPSPKESCQRPIGLVSPHRTAQASTKDSSTFQIGLLLGVH